MKARGLTLITALVLAGCTTSGDLVTLLPAAQERPVGAVAVLDDSGDAAVLTQANQQATLSARSPRVRQLDSVDPEYQALINSLPRRFEPAPIRFMTAGTRISTDQISDIRAMIEELGPDLSIYQIEIAGYTDSVGTEQDNLKLSQQRANQVADLLREEGFEIVQDDVIGRGEYDAVREIGDNQESAQFRRVTIKIR